MRLNRNTVAAILVSIFLSGSLRAQIASGTIVVNNTTIAGTSYSSGPQTQGPGSTLQYTTNNNCELIGTINAVADLGSVTVQVTVNNTAFMFNGQPFAGRYYEMHPSQNGNQSATITLYFTQADFNAYNTLAATLGNSNYPAINVSANPNLKITVFHGLPSGGTTGPNGQYDNLNKEVITPTGIFLNNSGFYEVTFTTQGFSGFFAHTATNGAPLQLTLGDIAAANMGNANRIVWNTLTEAAGDLFRIERSSDGNHFETIGTLNAKGSSPETYSYVDETPYTGVNYYRLQLWNTDHHSGNYSRIVSAVVKERDFMMEAFPNPVNNILNIKIKGTGATGVLHLTDATGRSIEDRQVLNGMVSVSMKHLAQGIYFVKYQDNSHSQTIKIYKD